MDLNRRTVLGASALVAAAGSAHAATQQSGGSRAHGRALSALEAYAEQHRAAWGLPGMTVCVVDRDGYAGFVRAGMADVEHRTPVRADHLFQIGSISKMVTSMAAYSLIQEGKLDPAAHLRDLLPDLPVRDGGGITLQHLLNHTSGLPTNPPLVPAGGGLWTGYAAGSRWSYSNTGYDIAGRIIEIADGRPLGAVIEARVLRPLGMNASVGAIRWSDRTRYAQGYEPQYLDRPTFFPATMTPAPWADLDGGAGCVSATAADMTLFLRFLLGLAEGRGGAVFSDATAARFMADPADAPGWSAGTKYGNGIAHLDIEGRRYLHHTGGMLSFCSALHVDPEAGVACFASSNVSHTLNYRPRDVSLHACRLFKAARDGSPAPAAPPPRPVLEHSERYLGTYTAASGDAFEVRSAANGLATRRNGRDAPLQADNAAFFVSQDEAFTHTGLVFDKENDAIVRAWAGETEYLRDPSRGYRPAPADNLKALAGNYDADNRWYGPMPVYAREGKLWIGNVEPLTLLDDGQWRPGEDDWSPERVKFDAPLRGRPMRMSYSGEDMWRRL